MPANIGTSLNLQRYPQAATDVLAAQRPPYHSGERAGALSSKRASAQKRFSRYRQVRLVPALCSAFVALEQRVNVLPQAHE
jgi:hypothetical protein